MPFVALPIACCAVCLLAFPALAFIPAPPSRRIFHSQTIPVTAQQAKNKAGDDRGYKFGDISRGLASRFTKRVEQVTGKEYEFGDLSRHLDGKAKERICELTGKDSYTFGDMSI